MEQEAKEEEAKEERKGAVGGQGQEATAVVQAALMAPPAPPTSLLSSSLGLAAAAATTVVAVPTGLPTGGEAWLRPHVARPEELGYVPGAEEAEAKRERARARREAKARAPKPVTTLAPTLQTRTKVMRRPVFVYVERLAVDETDEDFDDFCGEFVVEECAEPFSRPLPTEVEEVEGDVDGRKGKAKGKGRKGKRGRKKKGKWSDGALSFLPQNGGWTTGASEADEEEDEGSDETAGRKRKRKRSEHEPEETVEQKRERVESFEATAQVASSANWMQVAGGLFGGSAVVQQGQQYVVE